MAFMVWAINIDSVPACGKEVVDPQTVWAWRGREVACIPNTSNFRIRRSGTPWLCKAAEGYAFKFFSVGTRFAVSWVSNEHSKSLMKYQPLFSRRVAKKQKGHVIIQDTRIITKISRPV